MNDDRRHYRDQEFSRPVVELISAYLDDRENLSSRELEHVEQLLTQDREAQQIHAELRAITRELGNLDPVVAPRSYHLDAEMVGASEPVVLQESSAWYVRHSQKVRWATAAAAMLFVFVLGADLIVNGAFSDTTDDGPVFDTNQSGMTSRQAEEDDAAAGVEEEAADEEEAEAFQEYAADDAGETDSAADADEAIEAEEESGTLMTEPTAEDDDGAVSDQDSDTSDEEIPPAEDAAGGDGAAEPEVAEESAPPIQTAALDESASGGQTLALDQAAEADEGDSDRRFWRIAEFSLVVVLGLLITAMIILPRLGGGMTRSRQGE